MRILGALRSGTRHFPEDGPDAFFNAEQNALIARNAERYYRTMIRGGSASWNVRDHHMMETLDRLVAHHGPQCRAIIWEHNTHVGDARFTDMARHGMVNVGQLVRERHGERRNDRDGVVLVGFGTHRGTVIASSEWGAPMERMQVPEARGGTWEDLLHEAVGGDGLFVFEGSDDGGDDGGIPGLDQPLGHRAIGVVYRSGVESWGNYVPTIVPRRYDAFVFIDESRAVDPLQMPVTGNAELPETFPSGM